jgi:hypothetical protein
MNSMDLGLRITPPRSGTSILDHGEYYLKKSINQKKIESEFQYFKNLPEILRVFHPEVKRSDPRDLSSYLIRKINTFDSAIVFASAQNYPQANVGELLEKLGGFLDLCPKRPLDPSGFMDQVRNEIVLRNESRCAALERDPNAQILLQSLRRSSIESFEALAEQINAWALRRAKNVAQAQMIFSHGDLCLSNILLFEKKLFLIDPRGIEPGQDSFRSEYYDLAKLSQCFLGFYDFINYSLQFPPVKFQEASEQQFREFLESRSADWELVRAFEASHFFSMTPLHSDHPDKMRRFLDRSVQILTTAGGR